MGRGVNGHITVNVGLNGNGNGNGAARRAGPSALSLGEDERNRRALRLRKEGWSYRRISASLGMTYASVCRLLDGEEARVPLPDPMPILPPRHSALRPQPPLPQSPEAAANDVVVPMPAPSSTLARIDELSAQVRALQQRIDTLVAINEGYRQQISRLERTVISTLQSEHRALGQRMQTAVKTLLERMLPTGFRARPGTEEDDDGG